MRSFGVVPAAGSSQSAGSITIKHNTSRNAVFRSPSAKAATVGTHNGTKLMRRRLLQPVAASVGSGSQQPPFSRHEGGSPMSGVEKLPPQTGTPPGGPQDASGGSFVPSSDTHPDILDPAESSTYTSRETADSPNHPDPTPPAAGSSSSNLGIRPNTERFADSAAAAEQMQNAAADCIKSWTTTGDDGLSSEGGLEGEDPPVASGGSSHTGGSSHSSSERRSHPVARAAGTALGTAAGTVLGAAGGPSTAGLGAALGSSVGRGLVDALSGTQEQAEVYGQGAEPEQVAEELAGVTQPVAKAAGDFADDVKSGAGKLQAAASDAAHQTRGRLQEARERVSGQLQDASPSTTAHQGVGNEPYGPPGAAGAGRHGSSSSSRAVEQQQDTFEGMGQETVDDLRALGLADSGVGIIQHDPPAPGSQKTSTSGHSDHHSSVGKKIAAAASAAVESVSMAVHTTADKVAATADSVPLPTFPPEEVEDSDESMSAGGGTTMPAADRAAEQLAKALDKPADAAGRVADRLAEAADDSGRDSGVEEAAPGTASTTGEATHSTNESLSGADNSVKEGADNVARMAASFGSGERSEKEVELGPSQAGDEGDNRTTTERSIDWAALADAEAVVKGDVGLPSMNVQDGLDLAGGGADSMISPGMSGAAGAAGGYGSSGLSGDSGEFMDEPQRAILADDAGEGEASLSRTMSSRSAVDDDLQSKTGLAIEDFETAEISSTSTTEQVAQNYGIGDEGVSPGVEEV